MSRSSFAIMALVCVVALPAGSASGMHSGAAGSSCSQGPRPGNAVTRPTPLQGPFLPLLEDAVAGHGDISAVHRSDDGTIHVGLRPEVTHADLCAAADRVFEKFGLPVEVTEKSVVAVSG